MSCAWSQEDITVNTTRSNTRQIIIRTAVSLALAAFIVVLANVVLYLFNPTLNRVGDFQAYAVPFVYPLDSVDNALRVLGHRSQVAPEHWVFVSSSDKVGQRLAQALPSGYRVARLADVDQLIDAQEIILVEEFGYSRHAKFQAALNVLDSLDKQALGVIAYKL